MEKVIGVASGIFSVVWSVVIVGLVSWDVWRRQRDQQAAPSCPIAGCLGYGRRPLTTNPHGTWECDRCLYLWFSR